MLQRDVPVYEELSGHLEATESVELRARVGGIIDRVHFRDGQEVKRGERLFSLDARNYQINVPQLFADIDRARAKQRGVNLADASGGEGLAAVGRKISNLLANLQAAGYRTEQVDEGYITRMHADHVGGLMAGYKLALPNAIVRADKRDADFWLSQANMDAAPNEAKGLFQGAMVSLNPYLSAGKFKPFDATTELVPGVRAVPSYGHTKGHTTYLVRRRT